MKVFGLLLVVLGALGLHFRGIPYMQKQKVLELGPLHATAEQRREIAIPPVASAGVLGLGVLLLLIPGRRRR